MPVVSFKLQVMAINRPSFAKRGPTYSSFGCSIRCVRPDQSAQTITVHYLHDGDTTLRFSFRKREYSVPVVLILKVRRRPVPAVPPSAHVPRAHPCVAHALGRSFFLPPSAGAGGRDGPRHLRRHCPGRPQQDLPHRAHRGHAPQVAPLPAVHADPDAGLPRQPLRRRPRRARDEHGRAARRAPPAPRPLCAPDQQPRQVPTARVRAQRFKARSGRW